MKKYILLVFLTFATLLAYSQDEGPPEEEVVPIDGGISMLLLGGTLWGIKKLKDKK